MIRNSKGKFFITLLLTASLALGAGTCSSFAASSKISPADSSSAASLVQEDTEEAEPQIRSILKKSPKKAVLSEKAEDLLLDDSDEDTWYLDLSKGKTRFKGVSIRYKKAISLEGKDYDVRLKLRSCDSSEDAILLVSRNKVSYGIQALYEDTVTGSDIGDLAESLASHVPQYKYRLGGRSLSTSYGAGIDCAHFVGYVYGQNGYDITSNGADANVTTLRTVLRNNIVANYNYGPIPLSQMKRGDILIFFTQSGHDSHTAIYLGNGMIAHAADPSLGVCVTNLRYNEATGIAGYNHKRVQFVIRLAPEEKEAIESEINLKTEIEILDAESGWPVDIKSLNFGMDDEREEEHIVFKNTKSGDSSIYVNKNSKNDEDAKSVYKAEYGKKKNIKVLIDTDTKDTDSVSITTKANTRDKALWSPEIYMTL